MGTLRNLQRISPCSMIMLVKVSKVPEVLSVSYTLLCKLACNRKVYDMEKCEVAFDTFV